MTDALKAIAAREAAGLVRAGMTVGLGTGSTAAHAVRRLGERIREEGLAIRGLPTSKATEALARECGIPLVTFEEVSRLDVTIDGADEVNPMFDLVKGGGGALLREKVVASRTRDLVIIVDPAKLVAVLGVSFPLPVEVIPFARRPVEEGIRGLGGAPALRMREGAPYETDSGNWILDVRFPGGIPEPAAMEDVLDRIPGVVETGLFCGMTRRIVVGRPGGAEILEARPG